MVAPAGHLMLKLTLTSGACQGIFGNISNRRSAQLRRRRFEHRMNLTRNTAASSGGLRSCWYPPHRNRRCWQSAEISWYWLLVQVRSSSETSANWSARLELEILARSDHTYLGRRVHHGPLRIQRPFYPEGHGILHLYLLHPPGGVVGGDHLEIDVDLGAAAHAVITTPAAQKLYRSSGATSLIDTRLLVRSKAALEWLPTETIIFDGAKARTRQRVDVAPDASFIGWEMACFGRPASGITFTRGRVEFGLELRSGGAPILIENLDVAGGSPSLSAPWGFAGCAAFGSLYCVTANDAQLNEACLQINNQCALDSQVRGAMTQLNNCAVLKVQAPRLADIRSALVRAWRIARPLILGQAALDPRIWAT